MSRGFLNVYIILTLMVLMGHECAQASNAIIDNFLASKHNFAKAEDVEGNYTIDLMVDAMINYEIQKNDSCYMPTINRFFELRKYHFSETIPYQKIPFCDVYFSYFKLKKDTAFISPFVKESYRMMQEAVRTLEGAICITHKGANYMLIDYLQNYIIRMARAGALSGDTIFYKEMAEQMRLYSLILQYPDSKLYSQGRGWLPDKMQLSPSAWSRGQGWLMRGIVTSLEFVPKNSRFYVELTQQLGRLANGLLKLQDKNGMWHTLPLLDQAESAPELSGTAMITYYLSVAIQKNYLNSHKFKTSIRKALHGMKNYIGGDCLVRNVSKGPGPLTSIDEYKQGGECGNLHGLQAVLNLQAIFPDIN